MTENYKKRLTGRKPKLLTRTHCVMVRFDDEGYHKRNERNRPTGDCALKSHQKTMGNLTKRPCHSHSRRTVAYP